MLRQTGSNAHKLVPVLFDVTLTNSHALWKQLVRKIKHKYAKFEEKEIALQALRQQRREIKRSRYWCEGNHDVCFWLNCIRIK